MTGRYEALPGDPARPATAELQGPDDDGSFEIPTTDKRRSHWWRLGRFSGGWSPTTNGWGLPAGWTFFVFRGRALSIEIGWHKR